MIKLKDSPKFKEDLANYQKSIAEITDESVKQECTDLLIKFVDGVHSIDFHHDAILTAKRLPDAIAESRANLANSKRKLDTRLAQYRASKSTN